MTGLENKILIQNQNYRLIAQIQDNILSFSLTVYANNFKDYKNYQRSVRVKGQTHNIQNHKRLLRTFFRHLQSQELHRLDLQNKMLIFPKISNFKLGITTVWIQLKQKKRSHIQILQQELKQSQFHNNILRNNYLKNIYDDKQEIKRLKKQILLLRAQKQAGLPTKKVKLSNQGQQEQHKMNRDSDSEYKKQTKLKSYISNQNKRCFQKIQIQNQQSDSQKQKSSDLNKSKKASILQNNLQVNSKKEQISEKKSSASLKWVAIKSDLNNFLIFDNFVKYEGINQWNRIIMNVPLINKQNQLFKVRVQVSKQNLIMIGVVSQKNKYLKPSNYELSKLKGKGYSQHSCCSEEQHFMGGFSTSDLISVQINYEQKIVQWSVNGSTFASQRIGNTTTQLYPCIEMYSNDDVIEWIYN